MSAITNKISTFAQIFGGYMNKFDKISHFTEHLLSIGKYSFTLTELYKAFPNKSEASIKMSLKRLSNKNKIISIFRGFYIIIPYEYVNLGYLPPSMFIDDLMSFLNRPYYISLVSAAAMHGAGHQQPQTHFVCTTLPSLRSTNKKGLQIKYISKRNFPESHLVQKKTDSGYVILSDPLLTSLDLINYYKIVGGFNRVATVLNELSDESGGFEITDRIYNLAPLSDIQRLGYLWENVCNKKSLANKLYDILNKNFNSLKTYKLISSKPAKNFPVTNRWKIIVNAKIEIDE